MFGHRRLSQTAEFRRIASLPRKRSRDWEAIALELTEVLKTPEGTMTLRPIQAEALVEIGETGGLFGPICVGGGKTLTTLLAPYILESKRPLLLLPAALIPKTKINQRALSQHWRIPMNIRMVSYDELGRVGAARLLEGHQPDLIIADECHRIKSPKAGVTRRVARYLEEHPDTHFVGVSGTMMSKSVRDFGHIIQWTHKDPPVPVSKQERDEWADALDEKVNPAKRVHPGPMVDWCPKETATSNALVTARRGFHDRMVNTPGVVATSTENVGASLYINALLYDMGPATKTNFETLRSTWERPDGYSISEPMLWRMYARQLALGFTGVWDPQGPDPWLNARRNWAGYARQILQRSSHLDTEQAVSDAVDAGQLPDGKQDLETWRKIRPTFKVNPKDVWYDTKALEYCATWGKAPGIIWVEHVFFGQELSKRTGMPYFGAEALDAKGVHLQAFANAIRDGHAPEQCIIASSKACVEGLDLQEAWDRNLVTAPSASAKEWEQMLGRTHRPGHRSDDVTVDVMIGCIEHWESLQRSIATAVSLKDMFGQPQKLTIADKNIPEDRDVINQKGARWEKQWLPG